MPDTQPTGYHQLAALLRDLIIGGHLQPGARLPAETYLMQQHGLARGTVRQAVAELRKEGLVDFRRGYGWVVRADRDREPVALDPGDQIIVRMPTPAERHRWQLGDGVPVVHVQHGDGTGDTYPADRTLFVVRPTDQQ